MTIYPKDTKTVDISEAKIKVYAGENDTTAVKSLVYKGDGRVIPGKTEVMFKNSKLNSSKINIVYYNNLTKGRAVVVAFGKDEYAGAATGNFTIK